MNNYWQENCSLRRLLTSDRPLLTLKEMNEEVIRALACIEDSRKRGIISFSTSHRKPFESDVPIVKAFKE